MHTKLKGAILITLTSLGLLVFLKGCVLRPDLDPKVVAAAETEMWKAYYSGDKRELASQLLTIQRNQFGLTWSESLRVTRDLAKAAMVFAGIREDYEEEVLPALIAAYKRIQKAQNLDFDPEKAARAELDWWVARRDGKRKGVESVGDAIGKLYGILYGEMKPEFQTAGRLRAEAATLRDRGGDQADWNRIEEILVQSYQALESGL